MNHAILDQGWGEFRRQLDYKLAWRDGRLVAVPPHNTRRTCPLCGCVSPENRRTHAQFVCVACGYENHADVVGAMNVLSLNAVGVLLPCRLKAASCKVRGRGGCQEGQEALTRKLTS